MKDLKISEIIAKRKKLKEDIETLVYNFTEETGIAVVALNLDTYAKRDMEGNLLMSNCNVSVAVQV